MNRLRRDQLKIPRSLAEDHGSTQNLIAAIESKDRRFRVAQAIFMVATFIALVIVISAQQRTLQAVQDQLTQAKDTATKQALRDQESSARIERRLDCMVVFFSQKDRTNLSIDNIDKCTLNRDGNIEQFFKTDDKGTSSVTPQPVAPSSAVTTPATQTPVTTPVADPVSPAGQEPPKGLMGLGVCLPLVGACL